MPLYQSLEKKSSPLGILDQIGVLFEIPIREAKSVAEEFWITIGTFSVMHPCDSLLTGLGTSGYQLHNLVLEALDSLSLGDQTFLVLADDNLLEHGQFSRKLLFGPTRSVHVARTEAMSILVHIPENGLELFGAGHGDGHMVSYYRPQAAKNIVRLKRGLAAAATSAKASAATLRWFRSWMANRFWAIVRKCLRVILIPLFRSMVPLYHNWRVCQGLSEYLTDPLDYSEGA